MSSLPQSPEAAAAPALSGAVAETVLLPAARGKALALKAGERVRLVNPTGVQCVDFWAFVAGDLGEHLSMDHVRSVNSRIYATPDTALVSNHRRPIVRIVEDTSTARHDTLLCPCNGPLYRLLGAEGYHRSCADNLHEGLAELGLSLPFTPASLNLFMCVDVGEDGAIQRLLPASAPGSHVTLEATVDAVLAFSSCPQDITPINGLERTPRDCILEVLR